jgi:hypothetical protein
MNESARKFKYSLQPLLTKLGWEVDTLNVELQRLNALMRQEERDISEVGASVQDAERRLRIMQGGAVIQVEKKEQIGLYLRQQYEILKERKAQLDRLVSLRAQVVLQMSNKRREVKALERHKEKKHMESVSTESRLQLKEADRDWLSCLPRKRAS